MRLGIIALLILTLYSQQWHYDHVVKHEKVMDYVDGYQKRVSYEHGE